jgi:hypothetical protein
MEGGLELLDDVLGLGRIADLSNSERAGASVEYLGIGEGIVIGLSVSIGWACDSAAGYRHEGNSFGIAVLAVPVYVYLSSSGDGLVSSG